MKELIMKRLFLCISLLLLVGMTSNSRLYAQEDPLDRALAHLPFSGFPIKEKFPEGVQWGINFDSRFPARFYDDLQCKKSSAATLAESNWDMAPALYLQIPLPDKSILGALTFGGVLLTGQIYYSYATGKGLYVRH